MTLKEQETIKQLIESLDEIKRQNESFREDVKNQVDSINKKVKWRSLNCP